MTDLSDPNSVRVDEPFHDGEREAQLRVGVADIALHYASQGLRDYMPDQHREFFAMLPFMVFAGVDMGGQPWVSLRASTAGFITSPDSRTLCIDGGAPPGDPLAGSWTVNARIGGLGIQPHTRRRNRVNGVVESVDGGVITLAVKQSFGNCAKYINGREPTFAAESAPHADADIAVEHGDALSAEDRELIGRADMFFIATAHLDDVASTTGRSPTCFARLRVMICGCRYICSTVGWPRIPLRANVSPAA